LFGARGVGKSTFLSKEFFKDQNPLYYDLLIPELEDRLRRNPESFQKEILSEKKLTWVVIDEIQKLPKLLDVVHHLIESTSIRFALTGSSARKLKRGSANLLAGRAYVYSLFPLASLELGDDFDLEDAVNWGSLPFIFKVKSDEERSTYLRSYVLSYVKEEVQTEQLVRNLDPFREFLEIAALGSGKIINYSKISRDVGVDTKSVINYYQILEDTLLGFFVPAYHKSVRKSQLTHPKFYFFDNGVKKALTRSLRAYSTPGTSEFGEAFEHWVLQEIHRLNHYTQSDYRMAYFATKHGAEVDLVLSRGRETVLIEIKSSKNHDFDEIRKLNVIAQDFNPTKTFYLSCDTRRITDGKVVALHWKDFLADFFF
jgi:predicted AAA+ superfamily ATPase